ncbi:MAG TPA: MBL fold metallo-hydrolase [Prolixibacteraceae bacterium]|nr:MBL fold metallo-hydrolase [Prolixibacteraceae bacterium]
MKVKFYAIAAFILCFETAAFAQQSYLEGKEVFKNDRVVFHQIDEHTWVGTGNRVYNESLYLVEGTDKAVLIDAGTNIKNLDRIVAAITKKPIILVATHVHGDHTGSSIDCFPEIYINPGDTVLIPQVMAGYKGKIRYLADGEEIDLGDRKLEVVFTPAHTPGSTSFIDKDAGYGFSGDSFGSGNLLLSMNFSTLIATCERMSAIMQKYGIKYLFPGHYYGNNAETKQRVDDMITLSKDVLSGKAKGVENPNGGMGLNLVISDYGVRINYSEKAIK